MRATGSPKNFNFRVGQVWRATDSRGIREFRVSQLTPTSIILMARLYESSVTYSSLTWGIRDEFSSTYQLDETSNAVQLLERYE